MKTFENLAIISIKVIIVGIFSLILFHGITHAEVITTPKQTKGVYVISNSELKNKFEYLGTVTVSNLFVDDPKTLTDNLIKKAKEKYPNCNAIIIKNDNFTEADIIKIIE